jgi:flagellar biosynthetic protein FlhB
LIGGFNISAQALQPNFERLNPIEGLGRIFAMRGLIELGKSLLKIVLIGSVLVLVLRHSQPDLLLTGRGDGTRGMIVVISTLGHAALIFAAVLGVLGGVDAAYQKYDHNKKLRMTRQELKDESKETDGDPVMRGRIRQMQAQMSKRRMMEKLPTADVVVTNPEHFAVALKYAEGEHRAPVVIAKGLDEVAMQIRMVASAHKIPTVEAPPLARALYATTRLDKEIPSSLYVAVAEILAYVYRLKQLTWNADDKPKPPSPVVDPELLGPYQF